jgi:hypothetical protein
MSSSARLLPDLRCSGSLWPAEAAVRAMGSYPAASRFDSGLQQPRQWLHPFTSSPSLNGSGATPA